MTLDRGSAQARTAAAAGVEFHALRAEEVAVGKDVLELLSSAMYVDPMAVYREYIQNAADGIDEARRQGTLAPDEDGRVDITITPGSRVVRIRDNGAGVVWPDFAARLVSIGGSAKRGTEARGFRGIGRLAGLGYAQELVFRSRVAGEDVVSELRWDCRLLRASLRDDAFEGSLQELISRVTSLGRVPAGDYPERFFEVELRGIVRLRTDRLMTPVAVDRYLSQVAPVPFHPGFRFGPAISDLVGAIAGPGALNIHINGAVDPVYRPYRNSIAAAGGRQIDYEELEVIEVPDMDGGRAALVWLLHHAYEGAIPGENLVKGLRLRVGNVQVGENALLEELFAEPRFNGWSVGEVHILDRRIVPNARRDNFEQNAHLNNLLNQLGPVAREVSRRCRSNSIKRNWLRRFDLAEGSVEESLAIVGQGGVKGVERERLITWAEQSVREMGRIAGMPLLAGPDADQKLVRADALGRQVAELRDGEGSGAAGLASLSPEKREMYEHLFELIYECSANRVVAKKLVDRILSKITSSDG
ncbi:MAG TPA: HSP90 family molecular chaperone-like protein [Allosphingosinicella sp.]